ncbi:MAG: PEP-CTERM sorting domain-containing protein [Planctomycetota bacterium]
MRRFVLSTLMTVYLGFSLSNAGIYSGPTDTSNAIDPAIASNDSRFFEWADAIDASRTMFAPNGSTMIDQTGGFNSLGDLDSTQIGNGDLPGFLTVTFPSGIFNGAGTDFAIFENGGAFFTEPFRFAELAYVEVSTNGADFARFPSIATNLESDLNIGFGRGFAGVDVTNVFNLAGKHEAGFGTPFDLDDLLSDPLVLGGQLDLNDIQFVRIVDIPGDGSFLDSQSNPILDPWTTGGGLGGFDFALGVGSGVGVFNAVAIPEPSGFVAIATVCVFAFRKRNRDRRLAGGRR